MNFISKIFLFFSSIYKNTFYNSNIVIISEYANWATNEFAIKLSKSLKKKYSISSHISFSPLLLRNKTIHFAAISTFIKNGSIVKFHKSNKIILTWFHVEEKDKRLRYIDQINKLVTVVHTSCSSTKNILVLNGIKEDKIRVVPLGVDINLFIPGDIYKSKKMKKSLGIDDNSFVIGSFQKDGCGWGEGLVPKRIKGPDIFCDTIEKLSKKYNIHVVLTGPARGYVKKRLDNINVPYTHKYFKKYIDIVDYYQILDLYLISSRIEGGPKAILESWACGIPLVSTKVGMAPDLIDNGISGLLAEIEDVKMIFSHVETLIKDKKLRENISSNALKKVKKLDWNKLIESYYKYIYKKFL